MSNSQPTPRTEPVGVHLTSEKLFQYLADNVSPAEKQQLEAHLQTCLLCTEALEGFAHADQLKMQADLLELNHLVKKRTTRRKPNTLVNDIKTWGVATAIIFLILISAAIVWNAVHTSKTTATLNTSTTENEPGLFAQPVQGYDHLNRYLQQEQTQLAKSGKAALKKGRVVLSFMVNPDSSLTNLTVVKSLGKATDLAAIDLIKKGPAWQPGSKQGQPAAQKITLPVIIK